MQVSYFFIFQLNFYSEVSSTPIDPVTVVAAGTAVLNAGTSVVNSPNLPFLVEEGKKGFINTWSMPGVTSQPHANTDDFKKPFAYPSNYQQPKQN